MVVDNSVNSRLQSALERAGGSSTETMDLDTLPGSNRIGLSRILSISQSELVPDSNANHLLVAGFEALDLLKIGLIVCGADGEVLAANDTAEVILRARDGMERDAEGVLLATQADPAAIREIVRDVASASQNPELGSRDRAFSLRRSSSKRALTLCVRAVTGAGKGVDPAEASVLVMILDSSLPVQTAEADLRQLFGLTSTEAQLSNLLMEGLSLEDCCQELGIRRTTARMHLRNIFAKTGVRRQGELVSLLLKSIGLGPRVK